MKPTTFSRLAGQYLPALRSYIEQGPQADLAAAHELGEQAVALDLGTLELAKMHDEALAALVPADGTADGTADRPADLTARAAAFFAEANTPIEKTHPLAKEAGAGLAQVNEALVQRTADLTQSHLDLQAGIARREGADDNLKLSQAHAAKLLTEAGQLQQHLSELARQILTAQEEERKKMSLTLQDEIAQTLLGIHVRLLTLQREASAGEADFQDEIAATRRQVLESVKIINGYAGELEIAYEG